MRGADHTPCPGPRRPACCRCCAVGGPGTAAGSGSMSRCSAPGAAAGRRRHRVDHAALPAHPRAAAGGAARAAPAAGGRAVATASARQAAHVLQHLDATHDVRHGLRAQVAALQPQLELSQGGEHADGGHEGELALELPPPARGSWRRSQPPSRRSTPVSRSGPDGTWRVTCSRPRGAPPAPDGRRGRGQGRGRARALPGPGGGRRVRDRRRAHRTPARAARGIGPRHAPGRRPRPDAHAAVRAPDHGRRRRGDPRPDAHRHGPRTARSRAELVQHHRTVAEEEGERDEQALAADVLDEGVRGCGACPTCSTGTCRAATSLLPPVPRQRTTA